MSSRTSVVLAGESGHNYRQELLPGGLNCRGESGSKCGRNDNGEAIGQQLRGSRKRAFVRQQQSVISLLIRSNLENKAFTLKLPGSTLSFSQCSWLSWA